MLMHFAHKRAKINLRAQTTLLMRPNGYALLVIFFRRHRYYIDFCKKFAPLRWEAYRLKSLKRWAFRPLYFFATGRTENPL